MCDTANLEAEYSREITDVMTTYEEHAKKKQFMIGRVISNKATKSITVAVQRRKFVSKYNSYQRWTKKVGQWFCLFVCLCASVSVFFLRLVADIYIYSKREREIVCYPWTPHEVISCLFFSWWLLLQVMAHDEQEECHVGDIVRIIPCKPKSKKKRHAICDILFKEPQIEVSKETI